MRDTGEARTDDPDAVVYAVGYGTGYEIGWSHGYAASEQEYQALLGVLRPVLRQPRHAELEQARKPTDEPCGVACGRCSRCVRHTQASRNRARYGTPDFPGLAVAS
jgi:hypothetical protein